MLAIIINYNNNIGEWRNSLKTQWSQISSKACNYSGMAGKPIISRSPCTAVCPFGGHEALPPSLGLRAHSYLYVSLLLRLQRALLQLLSCEFLYSLDLWLPPSHSDDKPYPWINTTIHHFCSWAQVTEQNPPGFLEILTWALSQLFLPFPTRDISKFYHSPQAL